MNIVFKLLLVGAVATGTLEARASKDRGGGGGCIDEKGKAILASECSTQSFEGLNETIHVITSNYFLPDQIKSLLYNTISPSVDRHYADMRTNKTMKVEADKCVEKEKEEYAKLFGQVNEDQRFIYACTDVTTKTTFLFKEYFDLRGSPNNARQAAALFHENLWLMPDYFPTENSEHGVVLKKIIELEGLFLKAASQLGKESIVANRALAWNFYWKTDRTFTFNRVYEALSFDIISGNQPFRNVDFNKIPASLVFGTFGFNPQQDDLLRPFDSGSFFTRMYYENPFSLTFLRYSRLLDQVISVPCTTAKNIKEYNRKIKQDVIVESGILTWKSRGETGCGYDRTGHGSTIIEFTTRSGSKVYYKLMHYHRSL